MDQNQGLFLLVCDAANHVSGLFHPCPTRTTDEVIMKSKARFWFLLACPAFLFGCGDDDVQPVVERQRPATEAAMLDTLEVNYRLHQEDFYADLLADDFRFYFDPVTRERESLPEFWDRTTDSTQTALLLGSEELVGVKINLTFNLPPQDVPGKPRWKTVTVGDTFLEIELGPTDEFEEGVTLLVDGQVQKFFFRRGRTEADTLEASATANDLYMVEWRDMGPSFGSLQFNSRPLAQSTTWSGIKSLFRS
jgi:hypothetical protein